MTSRERWEGEVIAAMGAAQPGCSDSALIWALSVLDLDGGTRAAPLIEDAEERGLLGVGWSEEAKRLQAEQAPRLAEAAALLRMAKEQMAEEAAAAEEAQRLTNEAEDAAAGVRLVHLGSEVDYRPDGPVIVRDYGWMIAYRVGERQLFFVAPADRLEWLPELTWVKPSGQEMWDHNHDDCDQSSNCREAVVDLEGTVFASRKGAEQCLPEARADVKASLEGRPA